MFCELLSKESYFEEREQLTNDGWFYCTVSEMEDATTLSEYQQKKVVTKLTSLGLIEYRVKGSPPIRYFKTTSDLELLYKYLSNGDSKKHPKPMGLSNTEETKELKPKKLGTNNTNVIIQKNDNNNGSFLEQKQTKNTEVINAIKVYMNDLYPQRKKKKHPNLKPYQYDAVYTNIAGFINEHCLDYDDLIAMMLNYINDKTLDTDWNINHFATEGILLNRMYNCGITS
jgi:phage terminase Nu1 subunit (DNA packaging protein)